MYDIAANESNLDTIHKVWPQTQTTYIWGPSTSLPNRPFWNRTILPQSGISFFTIQRIAAQLWIIFNPVITWPDEIHDCGKFAIQS